MSEKKIKQTTNKNPGNLKAIAVTDAYNFRTTEGWKNLRRKGGKIGRATGMCPNLYRNPQETTNRDLKEDFQRDSCFLVT